MARPNKKEVILNNLDKIEKWTAEGLTLKQIAHNLGISESTLYKYKANTEEFTETVKKGREQSVQILENTMFKAACGYTQTVKKCAKVKRCVYNHGKKAEEWEEMVEYEETETVKPDITAGIFLLKNWGNYMNEPRAIEARKRELDLKEKQIEENTW